MASQDDLTAERAEGLYNRIADECLDKQVVMDYIAQFARMTRQEALREAASRIDIDHVGGLLDAPCLWCGYNGERYWQMGTHAKECLWYGAEGRLPRICKLDRLASEGAPSPIDLLPKFNDDGNHG